MTKNWAFTIDGDVEEITILVKRGPSTEGAASFTNGKVSGASLVPICVGADAAHRLALEEIWQGCDPA